jgi:hypothetical protein
MKKARKTPDDQVKIVLEAYDKNYAKNPNNLISAAKMAKRFARQGVTYENAKKARRIFLLFEFEGKVVGLTAEDIDIKDSEEDDSVDVIKKPWPGPTKFTPPPNKSVVVRFINWFFGFR